MCTSQTTHDICKGGPACKVCFKRERKHSFFLGGHSPVMERGGAVWQWPYSLMHHLGFRHHLQGQSHCSGGHRSISWSWCFRGDRSAVTHCSVKSGTPGHWEDVRIDSAPLSEQHTIYYQMTGTRDPAKEEIQSVAVGIWNDPFTFWTFVSLADGGVSGVCGTIRRWELAAGTKALGACLWASAISANFLGPSLCHTFLSPWTELSHHNGPKASNTASQNKSFPF